MNIEDFINNLDYDNFDYFFHVTGVANAERIIEEGLLVDGNNVLNARNILETTTLPLFKDEVSNPDKVMSFLDDIKAGSKTFRDTDATVIIGAPKEKEKQIVSKLDDFVDDNYYQGIVHPSYIMGYFDEDYNFNPNMEYSYGNEYFYDSYTI